MARERGEELWAAACLRAALPGVTVRVHDDGSRPSMHDLDLLHGEDLFGACEVTAAADAESIELWNQVHREGGGRWVEPGLVGGWMVRLRLDCRVRDLRRRLPGMLAELEALGVTEVRRRPSWRREVPAAAQLDALGVADVVQSGTDTPGSIYFTLELPDEQRGAWVSEATGDALVDWLEGWVRDPAQIDNVGKLVASGASERHLFVLVPGFSTAPFVAAYVLAVTGGPLPTSAPELPEGVTHVWVMSSWAGSGDLLSWDGVQGWRRHSKLVTADGEVMLDD